MRKFAIGLGLTKASLLALVFIVSFSGCQTASSSKIETAPVAVATPTPQISDDNINRPTSEPYVGDLSIFESEDRAKNLQIERVMDILKITTGKSVADIGAGGGWFSVRAAKRVGNSGKVFAVEISQDDLNFIDERAKKENLPNIQTVLGAEDNPKLPENSIDAVLILKTYHEIAQPVKELENLRPSLKKDALVGVIDRSGNGADHGVNKETVIDEFKRAGFSLVDQYDFVKPDGMDYFLVFKLAN
ncbi:MAG: class I SAM-dependent methyltransferase [Pyrinomonadaceae bacterium]